MQPELYRAETHLSLRAKELEKYQKHTRKEYLERECVFFSPGLKIQLELRLSPVVPNKQIPLLDTFVCSLFIFHFFKSVYSNCISSKKKQKRQGRYRVSCCRRSQLHVDVSLSFQGFLFFWCCCPVPDHVRGFGARFGVFLALTHRRRTRLLMS